MKTCIQLQHPTWQTDCFHDAGARPCSNENCVVAEAYAVDPVVRMMPFDEDARESLIRCRLFHQVCRMSKMSPDNSEYWERVGI